MSPTHTLIDSDGKGNSVFPALIQIQPLAAARQRQWEKRRIARVLDHPLAKLLGSTAWLMVLISLLALRPETQGISVAAVLIGLLVGVINALRWLFGRS